MDRPNLRAVAGADRTRFVTGLAPLTAFGRAVGHLMTRPAFAGAPFGHIARSLAGQVNRGHYAFACRGEDIVGFVGWALTTELVAEAWLAGERGFGSAEGERGDCVLLNFWQADSPEVSRFLVARLTATLPGKRRLYAKRHYPDGRVRPLRLDLIRTGQPAAIAATGR
jgi:hemolysin-activating ACP:hemolysin acyltransferase